MERFGKQGKHLQCQVIMIITVNDKGDDGAVVHMDGAYLNENFGIVGSIVTPLSVSIDTLAV